jgi:hypothetical protein
MAEERRWEGDERGRGIASAAHVAVSVERLLAAMREPDWVAEDPEAHLVHHIRRLAVGPVSFVGSSVEPNGELLVRISVAVQPDDEERWRLLHMAAYGLISSFAESSTFIQERREGGRWEFLVTTGLLEGRFRPHGHVVRLVVEPATV